jgi:hypothetical protein
MCGFDNTPSHSHVLSALYEIPSNACAGSVTRLEAKIVRVRVATPRASLMGGVPYLLLGWLAKVSLRRSSRPTPSSIHSFGVSMPVSTPGSLSARGDSSAQRTLAASAGRLKCERTPALLPWSAPIHRSSRGRAENGPPFERARCPGQSGQLLHRSATFRGPGGNARPLTGRKIGGSSDSARTRSSSAPWALTSKGLRLAGTLRQSSRMVRRTWARRTMPWLGAVLLGLGAFVALLAVARGTQLRDVAPAFLAVGGVSLIARGTSGARRWWFLASSLAAAVLLFSLTR